MVRPLRGLQHGGLVGGDAVVVLVLGYGLLQHAASDAAAGPEEQGQHYGAYERAHDDSDHG